MDATPTVIIGRAPESAGLKTRAAVRLFCRVAGCNSFLPVSEAVKSEATFLCHNHGRKESVEAVGRTYNSYKDTADTRGAHFQIKAWDRKIRVSKDEPLPIERDSTENYENGSQETREEEVSRKYFENSKARRSHKYGRDAAGHPITWPCWQTENDAWSLYDEPTNTQQETLPQAEVIIGKHPWYTWWWSGPVDLPWRADCERTCIIYFGEDIEHRQGYKRERPIIESATKSQQAKHRAAKRGLKKELDAAIAKAGKKIKKVLNTRAEVDTTFRAQNGKSDETGTGFYHYDADQSVVDHVKQSGYLEKLALVQTVKQMSREDFENFIGGYPSLYLDALRQGWPVQEYERAYGLSVGSLKDAFDRRLKEAIRRMEHMKGEPLELTEHFNRMSQGDYDAFVRRGGTYLFYRNRKIKNPLVYLAPLGAPGSEEDWAMKQAMAAEYGRLLRTSLRNAHARSPQARKVVMDRVNRIWDSTAIFSWEPQPVGAYPRGNLIPPPCLSASPTKEVI